MIYLIEYRAPAMLLLAIIISAVRILKEYERGVIFFLGRFQKVKGPGLIIVIPLIQKIIQIGCLYCNSQFQWLESFVFYYQW